MFHRQSEELGPDPQEHAMVVLEVCCGNLNEAREICLTNMAANRARGYEYWQSVLAALTVVGEA
jgi:hypothetical protein